MLTSARIRSIVILALAVITGAALVVITVASGPDHERDHAALDFIPRQRELVQQLTFLAVIDSTNPSLSERADQFETNMAALRATAPSQDDLFDRTLVPRADVKQVADELLAVTAAWQTYRAHLSEIQEIPLSDPGRNQAVDDLQADSDFLLGQLDNAKGAINDHMNLEIVQVRRWQSGLLLAGSALAVMGFVIMRRERLTRTQIIISEDSIVFPADYNGNGSNLDSDPAGAVATRQEIAHIRELLTAYQYSQEVLTEPDPGRLMDLATEKAKRMLQADASALCLIDPESMTLKLMSVRGETPVKLNGAAETSPTMPLQVIASTEAAAIGQACEHCIFFEACETGICLSAPLQVGGETVGALCVTRHEGRAFDGLELRALELLASSVGMAVSNARLAEASRFEARKAGMLAERQRVAAELHDNLAQTLSYVNIRVEHAQALLDSDRNNSALDEIHAIRSATSTAYDQVREALTGLSEPPIADDSFGQELATYITELSKSQAVAIDLALNDEAVTKLDPLAQKQAMYIAREALANATRHARADRIWVRLGQADGQSILVVEDNGHGFDPQTVNTANHLGLKIMCTRAERIGGELVIDSQPGQGTKVTATFPHIQGE